MALSVAALTLVTAAEVASRVALMMLVFWSSRSSWAEVWGEEGKGGREAGKAAAGEGAGERMLGKGAIRIVAWLWHAVACPGAEGQARRGTVACALVVV